MMQEHAQTSSLNKGAPTYADRFSAFATSLRLRDIPEPVLLRAKGCVLDVLGICLASASQAYVNSVASVFIDMGGKPESSLIGWPASLPMANAALVHGSMSHGTDFDDTHPGGRMHPSSVIVPTALAVAQAQGASGARVLEAVVAGLECMIRIGKAGESEDGFHHRGLHPTTLCGVFAAALSAGSLLGLSAQQCSWAQGLAGNMASGSTEFLADGSWGKRIGPGWAAHGGIIAAQLAARGFTGPPSIYEGQWGLYRSHLREPFYDLSLLDQGLGSEWELLRLSARLFPCCARAPTHVSLALEMLAQEHIDPAQIASIECGVDRMATTVVCEPWSEKIDPADGYAAKFSLPYCVAAALLRGRLTMAEFEDSTVRDPLIGQLMQTMSYKVQPDFDPAKFPAALLITLKDGRMVQRTRLDAGVAGWPELRAKFQANAQPVLGAARTNLLADQVANLETLTDVSALMAGCAVG